MSHLKFIYFIALIAIGFYLFPFWAFVLGIWIGIYYFIKHHKLDLKLNKREKQLFDIIAIVYPTIETFIKFMLIYNVIPYSWEWLNRVEHFGFSAAIGIVLYPLLRKYFSKLDLLGQFLLFTGVIIALGNFNEFMEYLLRLVWGLQKNYALYYWDTIVDLAINVVGAIAGFIILKIVRNQ